MTEPESWWTIDQQSALAEIAYLADQLLRRPPPATERALGANLELAIWDIRGALRVLRHTARHLEENA